MDGLSEGPFSGRPLIPDKVDFYLWNITNSDQIIKNGEKPKLEQVGPFSYSQVIEVRFSKPHPNWRMLSSATA